MYFAVAKITFECDSRIGLDRKSLHALIDRLRSRFRVCVEPAAHEDDEGISAIALVALGGTSERLSQLVDEVVGFCESSEGLRVASEPTLIDHIDIVDEDE